MNEKTVKFKTNGTCANEITFSIVDGKVRNLKFERGCDGSLKGIAILAEGMDAKKVQSALHGVTCGSKETSCPDQLSQAIKECME